MSETAEHNRRLVSMLVDAISRGDLAAFDELYTAEAAVKARHWSRPFLESFPAVTMDVVHVVADGDTVVARLRCSGTHLGVCRGHAPTDKRFERVDEVYFFTFLNGQW
ncbi:ester cyclase [Pseudarthrobacter sp. R1]|uniref:ester cyclase n=1 Tax=Pseudarthrobacter sp. R1 TaxID=2944934 RepID=UPI00210A8AC6|nr:ester cyclase [Pseudarthrobacter sp. R1]MCQ6271036.1 ester cyclase [Pseudarthrobacter sp. R1]